MFLYVDWRDVDMVQMSSTVKMSTIFVFDRWYLVVEYFAEKQKKKTNAINFN